MPIQFRYDQKLGILVTKAEGFISLAEIREHLRREAGEDELGYRELFDAREARTTLTSAEIRALVEEIRVRADGAPFGPTAVVTLNDVFFGMARMLEILAEIDGTAAFAVFRDVDEGLRWLRRGLSG
jgi:hypothetical protein